MSLLPNRPDKGGTKGKTVSVKANIFAVTKLGNQLSYQFDVATTPEVPAVVSRHVWRQVELQLTKLYGPTFLAYDGNKNAFGVRDMPDTTVQVHIIKNQLIELPDIPAVIGDGGGRGGRGGGRGGRGM